MAIEDAAVLANMLWKANLRGAMSEACEMDDLLRHLSATRLATTISTCRQSEFLTRLQAGDGMLKRLVARYVIPALYDLPAASSAAVLREGRRLEFVGLPPRAARMAGWAWAKTLNGYVPRLHVLFLICGVVIAWFALGRIWHFPSKLDTAILSHV